MSKGSGRSFQISAIREFESTEDAQERFDAQEDRGGYDFGWDDCEPTVELEGKRIRGEAVCDKEALIEILRRVR